MAENFVAPKGRMTIRAGTSTDIRNGRQNRRIRLWSFDAKPGTTAAKLEAAYLASLSAVDAVQAHKDVSAKSGRFTEDGLKQEILSFALANAIPQFRRGRDAVAAAKREVQALEGKIKLRAPDTSDPFKVGLMLRAIDHVKSLSQKDRDRLTSNPDALDPIVAEALISAPASLTGISDVHRGELVKRALVAQHGDDVAELEELKRAIEATESAVETGRDEIRMEAGGFDPHKFNELAAPIEAKANAPWLKKYNENGVEVIRKVDMESKTIPKATPDEIERGVYARDLDEYNAITGQSANN